MKKLFSIDEPIHISFIAYQPDVQIYCDGAWGTPAWGSLDRKPYIWEGAEEADLRRYTFSIEETTCPFCIEKMKKNKKI